MPTPDQLIQQATRHATHLERLKAGEVRTFGKFLRRMERGIVGKLAGEEITDWTRKRLASQLAAIRAIMKAEFTDYGDVWRGQLMDLAQYEMEFEARSIENVAKVNMALPSMGQLTTAVFSSPLSVVGPDGGKLLDTFYKDWTAKEIARTVGEIRMGAAQGKTTLEIVRAIKGTRTSPGALQTTGRAIEVMTRTALQHTAAQAREATWNANKDIIKGVEWVSTLDARTTSQCRSLDGQIYPLDKGPRPPLHVGCRSTTVAALTDDVAIFDKGGTRAARDPKTGKVEKVRADMSYYDWLKTQPATVQDSIVGPTRGKLLRQGGLSAQRFAELNLQRNFKPATLAEMRAMEPVAFSRAGL